MRRRLPAGLVESRRGCPSRSSRPRRRRRAATTSRSRSDETAELVGARPRRAPQGADARAVRADAAPAARSAASSWPTRSSSSASRDGELILIDEVLTPDSSRFWPADAYAPGRRAALVRQAVRAGLAGRERLGPRAAAARAARRGRRATAAAVPRGVRADHRRAVVRVPRASGSGGPTTASMTFTFEVLVSLKAGLADPRARRSMARCRRWAGRTCAAVRVGKHIELDGGGRRRGQRARPGAGDGDAAAVEPGDRGLPDPRDRGGGAESGRDGSHPPRIGVITFPGSLDDRDALRAVEPDGRRAGVRLWHARRGPARRRRA